MDLPSPLFSHCLWDLTSSYLTNAAALLSMPVDNPPLSFHTQMAKLAVGLLTERYVSEEVEQALRTLHGSAGIDEDLVKRVDEATFVTPAMIKNVVGRNHAEFKTDRQQDALEYYQHFLEFIARECRRAPSLPGGDIIDIGTAFKFDLEQRLECMQSHKVRYTTTKDNHIALPIVMEAATNKAEVEAYEVKRKEYEDAAKVRETRS